MDAIILETEYLKEAVRGISQADDSNEASEAKTHALSEIVKAREVTNRQALSLLEKMYDDQKPKNPLEQLSSGIVGLAPFMKQEDIRELLTTAIETMK